MLKSISMVTISAPDLQLVEAAYAEHLDYRPVGCGHISDSQAALWGAPGSLGRKYLLMQPASGSETYLRFIESEEVGGYAPMRTFGWNAAELLVTDPDGLATGLAGSPFRIVGPPRNLSSNDDIRAMQAIGPAGELLYLTRIAPGGAGLGLESAKSRVDRVFIVVLGGDDLEALRGFYGGRLGLPVTEPSLVRISTLSNAWGMDPEHRHRLSIATISNQFLIELDQYPQGAVPRPARRGDLPPGISMVSFIVESLAPTVPEFSRAPAAIEGPPYNGRRAAATAGPAGELLEFIEAA